jgi:nitroimidazol reductase NimA-like FMN-containing flavoprotein (pyridoxamine 5'-phosphate oxidase superfamily)
MSESVPVQTTETSTDRNGLEVLQRDECLRLLERSTLGRVGVTVGALPVILPVNYRLVGDRIVFRTATGTKLDAATHNAVVAFEVDEFDPFFHTGWSVLVTGLAREVTDAAALVELRRAHVPRWAPSGDERIVEVSTEMLSGRRINAGRPRS